MLDRLFNYDFCVGVLYLCIKTISYIRYALCVHLDLMSIVLYYKNWSVKTLHWFLPTITSTIFRALKSLIICHWNLQCSPEWTRNCLGHVCHHGNEAASASDQSEFREKLGLDFAQSSLRHGGSHRWARDEVHPNLNRKIAKCKSQL